MSTQTLLGLILVLVQSAVTALLTTGLLQRWLEHYKAELSLALGRATRFDDKECAALEEAWIKTREAVVGVGEVLRKEGRSAEDCAAAAARLLALHDFLLGGDVYLPAGLRQRFRELDQALGDAVLHLALGLECREKLLTEYGVERCRESVLPTYQVLKDEMRYYLRHHREQDPRLESNHAWLRLWW